MSAVELTNESRQYLEGIADDTLVHIASIAEAAEAKLHSGQAQGAESLANVNTVTSEAAIRNLNQAYAATRESYRTLSDEPAIARVVVMDEEGQNRTYYICRTAPVSGFPNLASYRAPVGRLASLEIGTEFTLPNGTIVEVTERARLNPGKDADGWDSQNTVVESEDIGPLTIESLRELLFQVAGEAVTEDILGQLLAEESEKANIIAGFRRSLITKMGLRDQPILDQYQDEIFRLPLDRRLLILGPPGTGKTTTLIRRLGQKLDREFLDEDEQRLVESIGTTQGVPHASSWLMFTPTELLKQYLKEAFSREGVPASDQRIRTWNDYRRELARNTLGVLRTATGGGTFVLKDGLQNLQDEAQASAIAWFDDFDSWQREAYLRDLREAANKLQEAQVSEAQALGARLNDTLVRTNDVPLAAIFESLATELPQAQSLVATLKESSDKKVRAALNLQHTVTTISWMNWLLLSTVSKKPN
ncbi:hypothetical protein ULF88_05340 [Halopseudomonas pachastrellae]|nr:hypothetical protein [Halopseudomonas pachastrellae]